MARTPFQVEVLTPEGEVFNDEVEMVSTRTSVGSIGLLANHQPLLAMLDPTELRLYKSESDVVRFAQGEGYLQVVDNSALVLVEEAIAPDDIDRSAFESRLKEARDAVERAEEDSEERSRAENTASASSSHQAAQLSPRGCINIEQIAFGHGGFQPRISGFMYCSGLTHEIGLEKLEHVIVVPGRFFAFATDASFSGAVLPHQVDGNSA
jgi:F-type H+-transporting ATPase subunit epsilon